jgi:type VI secretion system protein
MLRKLTAFSSFLLALSSCGGGSSDLMAAAKMALKMEPTKVWLQKVNFEVSSSLNNDSPVKVHLLIVYEAEYLKYLSKLSADQYFEKLDQIKKDGNGKVDFFTWDVVPGQQISSQPIRPTHVTGQGILVFARYSTPGNHREAIAEDREVTLQLGPKDIKILLVKESSD